MPYPVSDQFHAALASTNQKRVSVAEIQNAGVFVATLGTVTAGDADIDITQQTRRTLSGLTVISQGLELDDLVPVPGKGSLLDPTTGNELVIRSGFDYQTPTTLSGGALNGKTVTQELCPLGVFRMTKPNVVDTGEAITINVTGNDRASEVSARKWTDVFLVSSGINVGIAIQELMEDRVPDLHLKYKFINTAGITVAQQVFGTNLAGANDPMADVISLATSQGLELFFDFEGALVLQFPPTTDSTDPSFTNPSLYAEGVNCKVVNSIGTVLDETTTYNGVVVMGIGSGGAPVKSIIWDTNPNSPLYYKGKWGPHPYNYETSAFPAQGQSQVNAQAQSDLVCQNLYQQVVTDLLQPSFSAVPNTSLTENDVLQVVRSRIGVDNFYLSAQITMPLALSDTMDVVTRAKVITPLQ